MARRTRVALAALALAAGADSPRRTDKIVAPSIARRVGQRDPPQVSHITVDIRISGRYLSDDGQYIGVFGSTGSVPELIREPGGRTARFTTGSLGFGVRF